MPLKTNTLFSIQSRQYTLLRFPPQGDNSALQAWDSADEYLLNYVFDEVVNKTNDDSELRIGIVNDDFGALSCALSQFRPVVFSDSHMAHTAIKLNCEKNELNTPLLNSSLALNSSALNKVAENPKPFDLVLIKIPRTMALLQQQLHDLRPSLQSQSKIIAAGKVNAVTTNVLKLFTQYIGETKTSLAVKKSRLIFAEFNSALITTNPFPNQVRDPAIDFTLYNHANVFCREQLDIGARLLLEHLPKHFSGSCIDLGCGNGVLGVAMLRKNSNAKIHFVDESHMAIASAQITAKAALSQASFSQQTQFTLSHCLQSLIDEKAEPVDLVLCNPPFHQQNVITDKIAWQMFVDAKRMLKHNGELRVVANRHLHYPDKLKRLFGACKLIASNRKFVVLSATKTVT